MTDIFKVVLIALACPLVLPLVMDIEKAESEDSEINHK